MGCVVVKVSEGRPTAAEEDIGIPFGFAQGKAFDCAQDDKDLRFEGRSDLGG
jgi:hypothetical protein